MSTVSVSHEPSSDKTSPNETSKDAKSAILSYIDERLQEWAEWTKRGSRLGMGYPPCSLEYRLMTEGRVTRNHYGSKPMPTHAAAEEMELLIKEMATQHRKMADIIKSYYLQSGGIRQNARNLHISHASFEMHLNTSRWWLAGRLSSTGPIRRLMKSCG